MSGGAFNPDDYVDVAERIELFYAKYPDGSIQTEPIELTESRVVVRAHAYRTPDDPRPASGMSQLNIPGTTNFTRGSEVENAETSAVGRAIAMLGFAVKKGIASRQEVRNKRADEPGARPAQRPAPVDSQAVWEGAPVPGDKPPVDAMRRQTPDGTAFGFVVLVERAGRTPQRVQVLCTGPLADAVSVAWESHGKPEHATVWGQGEQVPFTTRDGKELTYLRVAATRVMTPEWTVPPTDAPLAAAGLVDDLDSLPF